MSQDIFEIGKKYFIRTVTMAQVGELIGQDNQFLVFKNASWIADTGRFHDSLKNGTFNEVEPFVENVIVAKGAIVDATTWTHDLPTGQK